MTIYVEKRYCEKCGSVHFVEVVNAGDFRERIICKGEQYSPHDDALNYVKHKGKGYLIIPKRKLKKGKTAIEFDALAEAALEAHLDIGI
jgi:hypothetical protein